MKFVYNITKLKYRRKQLRRNGTESERILWQKLRKRNMGFKFFRPYSLEGCVMDFYCPEKRLGIEIDGGYHEQNETKIYDEYRQRHIEAFDIRIVRFKNDEIIQDTDLVIKKVNALLLE